MKGNDPSAETSQQKRAAIQPNPKDEFARASATKRPRRPLTHVAILHLFPKQWTLLMNAAGERNAPLLLRRLPILILLDLNSAGKNPTRNPASTLVRYPHSPSASSSRSRRFKVWSGR
jgi:hypothetical protein